MDWPTSPAVGDLYPAVVSVGQPQWQFNSESGWQRVVNALQAAGFLVTFVPVVESSVGGLTFVSNTIYTFTYLP